MSHLMVDSLGPLSFIKPSEFTVHKLPCILNIFYTFHHTLHSLHTAPMRCMGWNNTHLLHMHSRALILLHTHHLLILVSSCFSDIFRSSYKWSMHSVHICIPYQSQPPEGHKHTFLHLPSCMRDVLHECAWVCWMTNEHVALRSLLLALSLQQVSRLHKLH